MDIDEVMSLFENLENPGFIKLSEIGHFGLKTNSNKDEDSVLTDRPKWVKEIIKIDDESLYPVFIQFLDSSEIHTVCCSIQVLININNHEAVSHLGRFVDSEGLIGAFACKALLHFGDERGIPMFYKLVTGEYRSLRSNGSTEVTLMDLFSEWHLGTWREATNVNDMAVNAEKIVGSEKLVTDLLQIFENEIIRCDKGYTRYKKEFSDIGWRTLATWKEMGHLYDIAHWNAYRSGGEKPVYDWYDSEELDEMRDELHTREELRTCISNVIFRFRSDKILRILLDKLFKISSLELDYEPRSLIRKFYSESILSVSNRYRFRNEEGYVEVIPADKEIVDTLIQQLKGKWDKELFIKSLGNTQTDNIAAIDEIFTQISDGKRTKIGWRTIWRLYGKKGHNHSHIWNHIVTLDDNRMIEAIEEMGLRINVKDNIARVQKLIDSRPAKVRDACIVALENAREIDDFEAWKVVLEQSKSKPSKEIIFSLVRFYQKSNGEITELRDYIMSLLDSSNFEYRKEVILAVGMMKLKSAAKELINILQSDKDKVIRATAAESLEILKEESTLSDLQSIIKIEQHPMVRTYIRNAIKEIDD